MNQSKLDGMIETSLENLKKIVDVNTVVGEAIKTDSGVTVIPISKVSLGYVSGGTDFASSKKNAAGSSATNFAGGGGSGATILPLGFLVIHADGMVEFLAAQAKGSSGGGSTVDSVVGLIEKSPDIVEKFKKIFSKKKDKKDTEESGEETNQTDEDKKD